MRVHLDVSDKDHDEGTDALRRVVRHTSVYVCGLFEACAKFARGGGR